MEHYLPLYTERVKWTERTVVTERPLFSGNVFVRFSPQSRIFVISTPGVLRLLGDEESGMVSCEELAKICDGPASGLLLCPIPASPWEHEYECATAFLRERRA
jgi:transcription antitermination factor NusG